MFFFSFGYSQNEELTYQGLSLEYDLTGFNTDCDSLEFNGISVNVDRYNSCLLTITFDSLGESNIKAFNTDTLLIFEKLYKIKRLPEIEALIANVRNDHLSLNLLKKQTKIDVVVNGFNFHEELELLSYKIEVQRDKKKVFKRMNLRSNFNSEIRNLINTINIGDRIIFSDIMIGIRDFNPIQIEDFSIRITD